MVYVIWFCIDLVWAVFVKGVPVSLATKPGIYWGCVFVGSLISASFVWYVNRYAKYVCKTNPENKDC